MLKSCELTEQTVVNSYQKFVVSGQKIFLFFNSITSEKSKYETRYKNYNNSFFGLFVVRFLDIKDLGHIKNSILLESKFYQSNDNMYGNLHGHNCH